MPRSFTEEQKKAFGEKMRALRNAKRQAQGLPPITVRDPAAPPPTPKVKVQKVKKGPPTHNEKLLNVYFGKTDRVMKGHIELWALDMNITASEYVLRILRKTVKPYPEALPAPVPPPLPAAVAATAPAGKEDDVEAWLAARTVKEEAKTVKPWIQKMSDAKALAAIPKNVADDDGIPSMDPSTINFGDVPVSTPRGYQREVIAK